MSMCEHMLYPDQFSNISSVSGQNIQDELIWGLAYRNFKEQERNRPIGPLHSPIDIPFKICRAKLSRKAGDKLKSDKDRERSEEKGTKEGKKDTKPSKRTMKNPSLLDRNVMSQDKYMEFLSIPHMRVSEEPKAKKPKRRCELEPCPPRIVQLAVPKKRRVYGNWKDYTDLLPTEMLLRFDEILHTNQNLEPREARYYYKQLDRKKRKQRKKKKQLEKKKKAEKEKQASWQKLEIQALAECITEYIKDEPLFSLNYKQMLLSDGILERLDQTSTMKKPSRKTKNHYRKTVIEIADKFAVWLDTLTRFVDVQAVESDEDVPPVSISSLSEGEGEGEEGESEEESELSSEEEAGIMGKALDWGEEGAAGGEFDLTGDIREQMMSDLFRPEEGEGAAELDEFLEELDEDLLTKLIEILSNCSDEFLDTEIDPDKIPGVKYRDVLDKLKELKEGLMEEPRKKPFLEEIMVDWAMKNEPDKVDQKMLNKIHETAAILSDWLYSGQRPELSEKPAEEEVSGEETSPEEAEGAQEIEEGEGEAEGEAVSEVEETTEGEEESKPEDETQGETEDQEATEGEAEGEGEGEVDGESDAGEETEKTSTGTGAFDLAERDEDKTEPILTDLEGEEALDIEKEYGIRLGGPEEEEEVSVMEEPGEGPAEFVPVEEGPAEAAPSGWDGQIIKGHKPSKTFEHSPDTVCCLSLKTWAVWLLEITHNAHNWTKWINSVIQQVREYAATVRGDVKLPSGEPKLLKKSEWRKFIKETEENIVAWRQYSAHVKDLSNSIVENFHGKKVNCCPKCLEDHLIKNVVVAHDTLQALTEAISCAAYWQRCLDALVEKTSDLTGIDKGDEDKLSIDSEESGSAHIEEIEGSSGESVYEIEGIEFKCHCKE